MDDMRRYFWIGLILCGALMPLSFSAGAQESAQEQDMPRFFESLGDVPLMPGMDELPDSAVIFDKPGGRIIEATGVGEAIAVPAVQIFYENTLPQMGWQPVKPGVFVRQSELLTIRAEAKDDYTMVYFMIRPSGS